MLRSLRLALPLAALAVALLALQRDAAPAAAAGTLTLPFPSTNYVVTQGYWTNHFAVKGGEVESGKWKLDSGCAVNPCPTPDAAIDPVPFSDFRFPFSPSYHEGHPAYDLVPLDTYSITASAPGVASVHWDANCGPDPSQAQPNCEDSLCGAGESYGRWVDVDHGGGLHIIYSHLRTFTVADGAAVLRGQELGIMGNAGCSTGDHLHFQVRLNGANVDPGDPKTCDILSALWTTCPASHTPPPDGGCPFGAEPCQSVSGDVDCDTNVNSLDALRILRGATGLSNSGNCFAMSADVNCSATTTSIDALLVLRHTAHLPVNLPQDCPPIGGYIGFP
jgi:hypothetical protein